MPQRSAHRAFKWLCFCALWFILGAGSAWAEGSLAVLYPEVREPYRSVFQTIISGIESRSPLPVKPYALPKDARPDKVKRWLSARRPEAVIALGSRGLQIARTLKLDIPVIVGSVLLPPDDIPGISLAADPDRLFRPLKTLAPKSRRIFVVYNPAVNQWLIDRAAQSAKTLGLELTPYPARDLRDAVGNYRDLIQFHLRDGDIVWLPLDNLSANDKVVLPLLLAEAWEKNFIILSNKPGHAKMGALFSFYPDNFAMGQRLAEMTPPLLKGVPKGLHPVGDLQMAVNLRTAAHLGLTFTSKQQENFNLTFP